MTLPEGDRRAMGIRPFPPVVRVRSMRRAWPTILLVAEVKTAWCAK